MKLAWALEEAYEAVLIQEVPKGFEVLKADRCLDLNLPSTRRRLPRFL
ncbi:MAG: hypothetical protein V1792_03820 [Pseudomonadota bacterium]